ncbi:hypothetical protein BDV95DRAFT_558763 [Massariosphaeria phaeospora]|uniref:Fumarylacetoacetate hydrolase-like protein n=1 Tax=Massariosphaeria phaeospora TaxID=100035 RepID=A0A7C8MXA9_9PLEO|nr:hypothetical protein BDV95DRAFT_558763 [Massariosphaeria phaeospora]
MSAPLTNYITYSLPRVPTSPARTRIGHLDHTTSLITPLSWTSGTPLSTLYEVIKAGPTNILASDLPALSLSSVKVLPPLPTRDVIAIGKNYPEHAKEFNKSGYDASDNVDIPSHPVVFTKRSTSIIAHGEDILLFPEFTETLDYEGEIGVIIGKGGRGIKQHEAAEYVWGYTILNDVTARERQRDHKQFYIGKSGDTFCPMGPIAVPKTALPPVLCLETRVNGSLRQKGSTADLIFSVPKLIETISEAQTLRPGDVIATGTPAGVGFGLEPPQFLKEGDVVEISVSGLGMLRNKVGVAGAAPSGTPTYVQEPLPTEMNIPSGKGYLEVGDKLFYALVGPDATKPPILFIHDLSDSHTSFYPLIHEINLHMSHRCILYDFEGHGLSPTKPPSVISIQSLASDLYAIFTFLKTNPVQKATIIANGMGCLIAATFAIQYPEFAEKLVMINPPLSPSPTHHRETLRSKARAVREYGMAALSDDFIAETGRQPVAWAPGVQAKLSQDPEGFAKALTAYAEALEVKLEVSGLEAEVLVVSGNKNVDNVDDFTDSEWVRNLPHARLELVEAPSSTWLLDDYERVGRAVQGFL